MSYDLMVFDPKSAPTDHEAFMAWYNHQTEWKEPHGYDDPSVTTESLRRWFLEMIAIFPPMNGPYAVDDPLDESAWTDYSIGTTVIYAAFAWSKVDEAYSTMFRLAEKHHVGFFDVSSDGAEVWLPSRFGTLVCAHSA